MARVGKPLRELHVTLDELSQQCPDDLRNFLAGIDGPKFITSSSKRGAKTLAVLLSHEKWKIVNRNVPAVNPHKAQINIVGGQAYMVIPAVDLGSGIYQASPETGLKIITEKRPRKTVVV